MRIRTVAVFLGGLVLSVAVALWWMGRLTSDRPPSPSGLPTPTLSSATTDNQKARKGEESRPPTAKRKMSDLEFDRLKVTLPAPVYGPWKAPLLNSDNCLVPENKEAALRVLPGWIRKAVSGGESELAALYLGTLFKLSEDADPKVAAEGVIAVYRLGDYKGTAVGRMREWIKSGASLLYTDSSTGGTTSRDIRSQVIEELQLNNDRSLDEIIYDTWSQNRAAEGKELATVDYAYYLEEHGRSLPTEYWLQRLSGASGFEHALDIAEQRKTPELTAKLQDLFEQLRLKAGASAEPGRVASVAATLFRQTGDAGYLDYLIQQAHRQLASPSFESSLGNVLQGLAKANDKAVLKIVAGAMQNQDTMIRETAMNALGKSQDPAATELLFDAATQKAKQGEGFPAVELHALLAQNNPNAESKYVQLKQALLSEQLGWPAVASDFDKLEFFRMHGRKKY